MLPAWLGWVLCGPHYLEGPDLSGMMPVEDVVQNSRVSQQSLFVTQAGPHPQRSPGSELVVLDSYRSKNSLALPYLLPWSESGESENQRGYHRGSDD